MPKISVIMPVYNGEKYVAEAIDSILAQTYGDFEFIILNDCSNDKTEEIVLSYQDPRIVYLKNEKNLGVAETLNRGLAVAEGLYIARMDADDISQPERLAKQLTYLQANPDMAVCGSGVTLFGAEVDPTTRLFEQDPCQMKVDMLFSCGVAHPSVMMRTDVIRALGGYDPQYNGIEDYELWCRVLEKHGIAALPEVLLRYRIHGSQVTQNPSPRYREQLRQLKVRQLEKLGIKAEEAEPYILFCQGEKPDTLEEIKELDACFAALEAANRTAQQYDPQMLKTAFASVILSAALRQKRQDQKKLISQCHLLKGHQLLARRVKQTIKKLLGRN